MRKKVALSAPVTLRKETDLSLLHPLENLQNESFIPYWVEGRSNRPCLLFCEVLGIRDQLEFHIGIRETIGIHRDQVKGFAN